MNQHSTDVRMAVRQGRLEAHFQPIVDLETGRFHALEARVRWSMPGELLTARQALEQAAARGQLMDLDFAVLERASADAAQQHAMAMTPLPVAVNLAVRTVLDPHFLTRLEQSLDNSAVQASAVRLEFPLDAFSSAQQLTRERLRHVVALGFTAAVDHVGNATVFDDLLADLPLTAIKLDEALILQLPHDAAACATVQGIVAAAARHGIPVGGEGIGRIEQLNWLKEAGCAEGQGMLICRPAPLKSLAFLLQRGRCW